jgi:hypothetical protein
MILSSQRGANQWKYLLFTAVALAILFLPVEPLLAQDQVVQTVKPAARPQLFTTEFYTRLLTNIVTVVIVVMAVYLPIHRKKDYFFTFLIMNFLVFIITFLINKTSAFSGMGTALGLLAFFSLLRLRTETITMKDMTYLFVVLTIGLVNATMSGPLYEMITLDVVIVAITYGLDKEWLSKSIHMREIKVDSLENIVPQQMDRLITDLRSKTGLEIQRVKIQSVDLTKNCALLHIYHY